MDLIGLFLYRKAREEYMTFFKQLEENPSIILGIHQRIPIPVKYEINETSNVRLLYMLETKEEISTQLKKYFGIAYKNK